MKGTELSVSCDNCGRVIDGVNADHPRARTRLIEAVKAAGGVVSRGRAICPWCLPPQPVEGASHVG